MPPKKNVSKSEVVPKIPKAKVQKPKIKKEKPKLKIPTVCKLKISIPGTGQKDSPAKENAANTVNSGVSPVKPATKKEIMLDRINEVSRAQLVKNSPVNMETEIPEKKKRGRKKKIQPEPVPVPVAATAEVLTDCPENTAAEAVGKKRRVCKKKKMQPEPVTDAETSAEVIPKKKIKAPPKVKPSSNGLIKKPKVPTEKTLKKNLKSTKPKLTRQKTISNVNNTVQKKCTRSRTNDEETIDPSSILKVKSQGEEGTIVDNDIKKTVKRKYVKRKMIQVDQDSTITSPSILSQSLLEKTHDKEIQKPLKSASERNQNPDSRRTSTTSASQWSWTKDISGSSTTTCLTVCSTDFVRIDEKLPFVKLNNCDALIATANTPVEEKNGYMCSLSEDCSSSSSSSSSDSSTTTRSTVNDLNLSTSSVSPVKLTPRSPASSQSDSVVTKQLTTLEKLSLTLKKFNLDFHAWNDNDEQPLKQMETYEKTIFEVMSEERSVLMECNFLAQILSNKCVVSEEINDTMEAADKETDFVKPSAAAIANKNGHEGPRRRDSMAFDPNDDDDALSIFAESITGYDSSRVGSNASLAPDIPPPEEYVPRPIRDTWAPVERTYQPSKIDDIPLNTKKLVCEKQNADSTSLHKEPEIVAAKANENVVENRLTVGNKVEQSRGVAWDQQQQLTICTFKPEVATKSFTLRGVCFFNLISTCKYSRCKYKHWYIDVGDFTQRLAKLSEETFIREYLLIVKYAALKIMYMPCFVSECQRRDLPKILVEMVIIFINKSNPFSDKACKIDTIESTLLYLNSVNLAVYEDRLKYKLSDGYYLCEVFMATIANTQNFWRFKPVFLALASFMVRERRTFTLEVAARILERVCIFQFEPPLALVLLSIIELTDGKIFDNSMIDTFEKQLRSFSSELYERFLTAKDRSVSEEPQMSPARGSLAFSQEAELPCSVVQSEPENRYTSPDTTNLDNQNKPITEPVITRTINLDKIQSLTARTPVQNSYKWNQQDWNHQPMYSMRPRFTPPVQVMQRHQLKRPMGRQVQYGPRLCKYPRRFGPDFYGNQ